MDATNSHRTMKPVDGNESSSAAGDPAAPPPGEDALPCPVNFIRIRVLSRGAFGKKELVVEKSTGKRMVLKYHDKARTRMSDYLREFHTSCRLVHPAVLVTYDQPIDTDSAFMVAEEYASQGDLLDAIPPRQGLDEVRAKLCLHQTASALAFMHKRLLVHGNVKPENILVFDAGMATVKLSGFRNTQRQGDTVTKRSPNTPYTAPETCTAVVNESYVADYGQDVWAFGVLVFCVLSGAFPWGTASAEDTSFRNFTQWHRRRVNVTPAEWRRLSPKLQKFLKKALNPNAERRCSIGELNKYMHERWLVPTARQQDVSSALGRCPSDEASTDLAAMKELRVMLENHGVVTRSDSSVKRQRTDEWVRAACSQKTDEASKERRKSSR